MFDGGAGYFVRRDFAIGVSVSLFTRAPIGTVSITTPDPLAFNSFKVLEASPALRQTDGLGHLSEADIAQATDGRLPAGLVHDTQACGVALTHTRHSHLR